MIKLNIGCGNDIQPDYINIDLRQTHYSVIVADIRELPYEPNAVDEIRAMDVYEHVSFIESKDLLKYWSSLLKTGGRLTLLTTSLEDIVNKYVSMGKTVQSVEKIICTIFGGQTYPENSHFTSGHHILMEQYLKDASMENINIIRPYGNGTNMLVTATKI